MKIKNLILLIFLLYNICLSQWVQIGPYTNIMTWSVVVKDSIIFAGTDSTVYRSTDKGATWVRTSLSGKIVTALTISGSNVIAGTSIYGAYLSTNNGNSWVQLSTGNDAVWSLSSSGRYVYECTSNNGLFISSNYGANWQHSSLSILTTYSSAVSGNRVFVGTGGSGVFVSTNYGITWSQTSLNYYTILSLASSGPNVYSGTNYHGVFVSTDKGDTWVQNYLNGMTVYALATNGTSCFASIGVPGIQYSVYVTTNFGNNWVERNEGMVDIEVNNFSLCGVNIFAATYGYSVWRRPIAEMVGINSSYRKLPAVYQLSQNFPNPFNPTTKIKFSIPNEPLPFGEGKGGGVLVKLIIYDILGREIATLVNKKLSPGTHEVEWDGSNFSSGVYFYQLKAGDYVQNKKMILLK